MYRKKREILGGSPELVEFVKDVPFESLGARVRNALDSGVRPVGSTPLAFDEAEDGDFVDPLADPHEDMFSVSERLDSHERRLLAKRQEVDKASMSGVKSEERGEA